MSILRWENFNRFITKSYVGSKLVSDVAVFRAILGVHRAMSSSSNDGLLFEMVRSIVPPLATHLHKGQSGKIGVIGGCQQ
jgi:hypothetical protein